MNTPIHYVPSFTKYPNLSFARLSRELEWTGVAGNRMEYYVSDSGSNYTYGKGRWARTYMSQPKHEHITFIKEELEAFAHCKFDVCFLNMYRDGSDQLGWHADDSPEMDDERPIGIVSLGAKRSIYFRENGQTTTDARWLEHGSLCLMAPGMQDTHQHRIPKSSVHGCGPRVSLTFRGLAKASVESIRLMD